jgi:hypothetical protein
MLVVKSFLHKDNEAILPQYKRFAKEHEAYRKDVEQTFGIMQSRWDINCSAPYKAMECSKNVGGRDRLRDHAKHDH